MGLLIMRVVLVINIVKVRVVVIVNSVILYIKNTTVVGVRVREL